MHDEYDILDALKEAAGPCPIDLQDTVTVSTNDGSRAYSVFCSIVDKKSGFKYYAAFNTDVRELIFLDDEGVRITTPEVTQFCKARIKFLCGAELSEKLAELREAKKEQEEKATKAQQLPSTENQSSE